MIDVIQLIAWMLVALFVLVSIHEFGHFWVARLCGVRVLRYSIGFGKPFLRWQRGETEFALAPIPLGGYVKMYGEGQSDTEIPADQEAYSFSHKNVWQRMAIVVAGPVANFLLGDTLVFYGV